MTQLPQFQLPQHSVFDFSHGHSLSRPIVLADGRYAHCFYLGAEQQHALVICQANKPGGRIDFLLNSENFAQLQNQHRSVDVLNHLERYAQPFAQTTNPTTVQTTYRKMQHQNEITPPQPESATSIATRTQRRSLLDRISTQLPQQAGEFGLTDAQLQNAAEAALFRQLTNTQGDIVVDKLNKLVAQAKTPLDQPSDIPPSQTTIFELPQVLRSATIISYVRMQIPNNEGGLATLTAPISLIRFDAILLNGALFREEINFQVTLGRYIETYRKLVIKQTAFGFGLSIGLGAVPPPPENVSETKEGDQRFEKGQAAKDKKDDPDTGGETGNQAEQDKGGTQSNQASFAGFSGIGASFSAAMVMKKHLLIERSTDDYVAAITPHERIVERLN